MQVLVQSLGIVVAAAYAGAMACAIFWLVERTMGLRIGLEEEDGGSADPLLGDYDGRLRVTVRRLSAWRKFQAFPEYMRLVLMRSPAPREARREVTNKLKTGELHFIRDDDTEATERDVNVALDGYFNYRD